MELTGAFLKESYSSQVALYVRETDQWVGSRGLDNFLPRFPNRTLLLMYVGGRHRRGQQRLLADVRALRHFERELVVRGGDGGTAAAADGAACAVHVADVLKGESGGESEGCDMTRQDRTPLRLIAISRLRGAVTKSNEKANI